MAETTVVKQITRDGKIAGRLCERSNVRLVRLQLANAISDCAPAPLNLHQPDIGIASRANS